jgi:uncharacterized membrane protein YjgN (DUF898 family)
MATKSEDPLRGDGLAQGDATDDAWKPLKSTALQFSGHTLEYVRIWLANLAVVVATCGIYAPWARVRTRQYFLAQTQLGGSGFEYRANPRAMVYGWIVFSVGLALLGLGNDWVASAIATAWIPSDNREFLVVLLSLGLGVLSQWPLISWLLVQSMRYNASRTLYRNLRFGFGSQAQQRSLWREMLFLTALGAIQIPTLGLLWPYFAWRWRRFQIRHRRFGTTPFTFTATAADYRSLHLRALPLLLLACGAPFPALGLLVAQGQNSPQVGLLLVLLLLGITTAFALGMLWSCWLEAAAARLTWRSIRLGDLRFHCTWRAGDLMRLRVGLGMALVFSLGLAWPWVRIRNSRYRLERILISPAGALEGFLGAEAERISAMAEGAFTLDDPLSGVLDISL